MNKMPVDYTQKRTPKAYACKECGAYGCKLWRQYQTFSDHIRLLCATCAMADQKVTGTVDDQGRFLKTGDTSRPGDQIEWLVPAIPTVEGDTFWGYTSIPEPGVDWWRGLPSAPAIRPTMFFIETKRKNRDFAEGQFVRFSVEPLTSREEAERVMKEILDFHSKVNSEIDSADKIRIRELTIAEIKRELLITHADRFRDFLLLFPYTILNKIIQDQDGGESIASYVACAVGDDAGIDS